jgi:hypothetical protein
MPLDSSTDVLQDGQQVEHNKPLHSVVGAVDDPLLPADSTRTPTLSVVLPTLDEEAGIRDCIEGVKAALKELSMYGEVIVSDSSTDRTPEIAREMGAIVVDPDQDGYGHAYRYAFRHVRGDYIVLGDADTTYDFEELPKLFRRLTTEDADLVIGSRFDGEIEPGAMPILHRYVGNPLLTKFLNSFYDVGVSDAHSGFRVLTRDALNRLELESDGMEFASEMVMAAGAENLRIEEVPITYHQRVGEPTLDSFRDGWRHVRFMLMNAPGYLFMGPAGVFCTLGALVLGLSLAGVQLAGLTFGAYTAIAGSLLTIIGFHVGCLALYSSIATDPIRDPADPITKVIRQTFYLEHGATIGLVVFGLGATYLVLIIAHWVANDFSSLPPIAPNMLGFTAVVLGIQIVFNSFFMSMLADAH